MEEKTILLVLAGVFLLVLFSLSLSFHKYKRDYSFILTSSFTFTFFSCIIAMFFAQDGNGLLDYEEFVHMLTDL